MKTTNTSKPSASSSAPKETKGKKGFTFAILTSLVFILFAYWILAVRNSYMLRWYEEMSFFESTRFFFRQSLLFPGGLLSYAGAWLTQFFFHPFLGATVLVILWLLTAWLTKKTFMLPKEATPLAYLVPMALLVSVVQVDEAWFSMKSMGYMYSNTLGYLFVMAVLWLYRFSERRRPLAACILLASACCYFIAGFYGLLAAFIGCIFIVVDSLKSKKFLNLAYPAFVLAVILVLPNLYYTSFQGNTVDNDLLYLKGLPVILIESYDTYLWIPFIVATAFLLLLAIITAFLRVPSKPCIKWMSVAAMFLCAVWCINADKKNEQLRATVLMLQYLDHNDWQGMRGVMSRIKEPANYTMKALDNLAIVNLGGSAENLDHFKPKNIDPRHAEGFTMTANLNVPLNYYAGDFNLSYRWAMEHSVQYGKRVFFLKYMVKSALLNGDVKLAKKYNDLLLGSMFHRKWAEDINRYIEDPSLIESNNEFKAILNHENKDNKN